MTHFAFLDLFDFPLDELSPLSLCSPEAFCSLSPLLVLGPLVPAGGSTLFPTDPFFEIKASITVPLLTESLDVLPDSETSAITDGGLSSFLLFCGATLLFLRLPYCYSVAISGDSDVDVLGVVKVLMQENSLVLVSAFTDLDLNFSALCCHPQRLELKEQCARTGRWEWRPSCICCMLQTTDFGVATSFLDKVRLGEVSPSTFTIGIELDESESLRTNSKCELTVLDGGSTKYVCLCPRPLMVIFPRL